MSWSHLIEAISFGIVAIRIVEPDLRPRWGEMLLWAAPGLLALAGLVGTAAGFGLGLICARLLR